MNPASRLKALQGGSHRKHSSNPKPTSSNNDGIDFDIGESTVGPCIVDLQICIYFLCESTVKMILEDSLTALIILPDIRK